MVKEYGILYKQKLESKKPSSITLNRISELENHLDVMNIIVTRQRVENEVRRYIFLYMLIIFLLTIILFKFCLNLIFKNIIY